MALRPLVGVRFQELFHSSARGAFHLSLTVLVRYRSPAKYLALPDGPGGFAQDSTCPALLRMPLCPNPASCMGLSPAAAGLSRPSHSPDTAQRRGPTTPGPPRRPRFGLLPVRSPLLGESLNYFLFLRVLRCFSSPRKPPAWPDGSPSGCRVVPFGNPRIKGHLRLPAAYRSLSRPSSLAGAKASSVRPSPLSRSPRTRAGRRVSGTLSRPRLSIVSLGTALSRAAPPYSFLSVPVCQISLPPPKKGGDGGE